MVLDADTDWNEVAELVIESYRFCAPQTLRRRPDRCHTQPMAARDIDDYLAGLDDAPRRLLTQLRHDILDVVPDAEECISYGMPAFKVHGKAVAGFAAFKDHLSYLPHSGSVLSTLASEVAGYATTKGSLHFTVDQPLPASLVRQLVAARLRELGVG